MNAEQRARLQFALVDLHEVSNGIGLVYEQIREAQQDPDTMMDLVHVAFTCAELERMLLRLTGRKHVQNAFLVHAMAQAHDDDDQGEG